jgi:predicted dehydrogenase
MAETPVRIGFIGAGAIARDRHLPGLKKIAGVELIAVANRTMESSQKVAQQWGFAEAMDNWEALIARSDIDAIFIGTWPYMHRQMSVAGLKAGKHVFCQARMAMDLADAQAMLDAAHAHPRQVNMICPPPTRMPFEAWIKQQIDSGSLGKLVSVELRSINGSNLNTKDVHWREDIRYSGRQIMAVGIFAETLNTWLGEYDWLQAQFDTPIARKTNAAGQSVEIKIPQVVHIHGRLRSDVAIHEYHCGVATDPASHGTQLIIRGLDATIRYNFGKTIELARHGQPFEVVEVPYHLQRDWRVEEDFIQAVRLAMKGQPWKVSPDFDEGILYMRKMEAIHQSARTGQPVKLENL